MATDSKNTSRLDLDDIYDSIKRRTFYKFFMSGAYTWYASNSIRIPSNNLHFMQSPFSDEITAKENHVVYPI